MYTSSGAPTVDFLGANHKYDVPHELFIPSKDSSFHDQTTTPMRQLMSKDDARDSRFCTRDEDADHVLDEHAGELCERLLPSQEQSHSLISCSKAQSDDVRVGLSESSLQRSWTESPIHHPDVSSLRDQSTPVCRHVHHSITDDQFGLSAGNDDIHKQQLEHAGDNIVCEDHLPSPAAEDIHHSYSTRRSESTPPEVQLGLCDLSLSISLRICTHHPHLASREGIHSSSRHSESNPVDSPLSTSLCLSTQQRHSASPEEIHDHSSSTRSKSKPLDVQIGLRDSSPSTSLSLCTHPHLASTPEGIHPSVRSKSESAAVHHGFEHSSLSDLMRLCTELQLQISTVDETTSTTRAHPVKNRCPSLDAAANTTSWSSNSVSPEPREPEHETGAPEFELEEEGMVPNKRTSSCSPQIESPIVDLIVARLGDWIHHLNYLAVGRTSPWHVQDIATTLKRMEEEVRLIRENLSGISTAEAKDDRLGFVEESSLTRAVAGSEYNIDRLSAADDKSKVVAHTLIVHVSSNTLLLSFEQLWYYMKELPAWSLESGPRDTVIFWHYDRDEDGFYMEKPNACATLPGTDITALTCAEARWFVNSVNGAEEETIFSLQTLFVRE